jgi:hypothetical protein
MDGAMTAKEELPVAYSQVVKDIFSFDLEWESFDDLLRVLRSDAEITDLGRVSTWMEILHD